MTSIFDFLDFRDYLKTVYRERKETQRYFSHRSFLKEAGVRNSGYLKLVMDNKRSLTSAMIPGFARALRLSDHETSYFAHLVGFNQAETAGEKDRHYRELKLLAGQVRKKIIGSDSFDLFEHWYIPVIRELVCLHDFKDDCRKIGKAICPPVTPARVRKALTFLIDNKMLISQKSGAYVQADPAIDTSDQVASLAVRNFNNQMIGLAREALDRFGRHERYARGLTIGVSEKTYLAIVEELQKCNDKVVEMVGADRESDRVYQLNFQLFPLTTTQVQAPSVSSKFSGGSNEIG